MPILIPRSNIVQLDDPRVFLVRDDFTDNIAAGSVDDTSATPGPDVRVVVDTDGDALRIGEGVANFENPNAVTGNPGLWYGAHTRAAGVAQITKQTLPATNTIAVVAGWDNDQAGITTISKFIFHQIAAGLRVYEGADIVVGIYEATVYTTATVLRAAGCFYLIKGGAFADWTLVWVSGTDATATLYPVNTVNTALMTMDTVRTMQLGAPWSNTYAVALGFATFTAANGTAIAVYPPEVGSQWAATIGTWEIQGNAAKSSALVGGIAIATVDVGQVDTLHTTQPTVAGGIAGIVLRYVDAANYVYAIHDATNARLTKRVAGVETDLIDVAAAYGAGNKLRVICDGTSFDLFYNNAKIGATQTIADAGLQTSTLVGLLTTDVTNTFAAADTYPRDITGYARLELRKYAR